MPKDTFLTTEQVAERYGLSEWGVRRMRRAGKIPAVNRGTDKRPIYMYSELALAKWEKSAAA